MKKLVYLIIVIMASSSCKPTQKIQEGWYRFVIIHDTTQPDLELPVNIYFDQLETGDWRASIYNADETITSETVIETEDSVIVKLPVFQSTIHLAKEGNKWTGKLKKESAGRHSETLVYLEPGKSRFITKEQKILFDPSGTWEVTMNPQSKNPEAQVGQFTLTGDKLTGTFLSITGDYRFLEGTVSSNQLYLSGFDGAHAVLYRAELSPDGRLINGQFIGGTNWQSDWIATRNENIVLPETSELTYLKPDFEEISFTFSDLNGDSVSLSDKRFDNKVVIIQVLGSWCPNCMDEAQFFAELYKKYKNDGLEIIGLCYEANTRESSVEAIRRFAMGTGADYTFLYAGRASKKVASESLPMLNEIISFPTSIFLDRNHQVRKIYTGFSGPGTGSHYEKLSLEIITLIEEMLLVPLK